MSVVEVNEALVPVRLDKVYFKSDAVGGLEKIKWNLPQGKENLWRIHVYNDGMRIPNYPTNFTFYSYRYRPHFSCFLDVEYSERAPLDYADIQIMKKSIDDEEIFVEAWEALKTPVYNGGSTIGLENDVFTRMHMDLETTIDLFSPYDDPNFPVTEEQSNIYAIINAITTAEGVPAYFELDHYYQMRVRFYNSKGVTPWAYSNIMEYIYGKSSSNMLMPRTGLMPKVGLMPQGLSFLLPDISLLPDEGLMPEG